ncbi:hypothetical protein [Natronorubrum texcoconense]|uniref:Uncharacterized protein n=1 Tax=Natronorubrum texcoconense TaxID=1095776 RepID=A0A1G9ETX0_9EURY|nr:hypothetical protein [Natronorubrum texcoconense]SDK79617.1 hypothetical protein SAMN04515672_3979 [Natronorubrum texcoconense]
MKGPGIFWMLQTAAGLSMAGPMFVVGFEFVRSGRTAYGIGFFALGAVALYFPTYLINRIGGPRTWIRRRLGRGDSSEDDDRSDRSEHESDAAAEPTDAADGTERNATLLDRLRR